MNLGIELDREASPANYLWKRRSELAEIGDNNAVLAAIQAGRALERWSFGDARRCWRAVVTAAQEAGQAARRDGVTPRRLVAEIDRVREAVETVLFDGQLPPDLAAWATRCAAKMCACALEHALRAYWSDNGASAPSR
ncbi:MAG: hypothetical protein AMS25_08825 [Gemmatimonas sp. SM23_52]|nr:MAG: hypothetical protein AMS25_08825 [Gemmatimonas sp. SM23_52]